MPKVPEASRASFWYFWHPTGSRIWRKHTARTACWTDIVRLADRRARLQNLCKKTVGAPLLSIGPITMRSPASIRLFDQSFQLLNGRYGGSSSMGHSYGPFCGSSRRGELNLWQGLLLPRAAKGVWRGGSRCSCAGRIAFFYQ